jgi:hypothetical protein
MYVSDDDSRSRLIPSIYIRCTSLIVGAERKENDPVTGPLMLVLLFTVAVNVH